MNPSRDPSKGFGYLAFAIMAVGIIIVAWIWLAGR